MFPPGKETITIASLVGGLDTCTMHLGPRCSGGRFTYIRCFSNLATIFSSLYSAHYFVLCFQGGTLQRLANVAIDVTDEDAHHGDSLLAV